MNLRFQYLEQVKGKLSIAIVYVFILGDVKILLREDIDGIIFLFFAMLLLQLS